MIIDTGFDFRTDSGGRDPDWASATLRRYHRVLWNKELPNGETLKLKEESGQYLLATVGTIELRLSSDAISNSLSSHKAMKPLLAEVPTELVEQVKDMGSTIGSRILFPGTMIAGRRTINVSRGLHPRIRDRFDLTLECIRRYYQGVASPLTQTLDRYGLFFELFKNFEGYVEFFLLQDLVEDGEVIYFNRIESPLLGSPHPKSPKEYRTYLEKTAEFLSLRNRRIQSASAESISSLKE